MIQVTADQIEQYRAQLADYPEALKGLDLLADCEGGAGGCRDLPGAAGRNAAGHLGSLAAV